MPGLQDHHSHWSASLSAEPPQVPEYDKDNPVQFPEVCSAEMVLKTALCSGVSLSINDERACSSPLRLWRIRLACRAIPAGYAAYLYNPFDDFFIADLYRFNPGLLVFVETKTHEITLVQMVVIQVCQQLLLASRVVGFPAPNLHFDDVLFAQKVDDHVRAKAVTGFGLDIIIADAIDDRLDIEHKVFAAFGFAEFFVPVTVSRSLHT